MHLADLLALARVIEDPLGRRRLAGIDVRHDAEVAIVLDGVAAGHASPRSLRWPSPAIVRKRPVGLGHPVRVLALLDGVSPAVGGIEKLSRKPLGHCLLVAVARG